MKCASFQRHTTHTHTHTHIHTHTYTHTHLGLFLLAETGNFGPERRDFMNKVVRSICNATLDLYSMKVVQQRETAA